MYIIKNIFCHLLLVLTFRGRMITTNFSQAADEWQTGHIPILFVFLLLIQMLMPPQESITELSDTKHVIQKQLKKLISSSIFKGNTKPFSSSHNN